MKTSLLARRRVLLGCAAALLSAGAVAAQAAPVRAIVTEAPGGERLAALAPQFEAWRRAGLLSRVRLLKALPDQQDAGFASLAIVELPGEQAFGRWRAQAAARLGRGPTIHRADLVWQAGSPSVRAAEAVHVASLYATHVPPDEYRTYTEQYIAPNMALQRAAGILSQATMYLQRDGAGGRGVSLLVMEYADAAAYARREEVKAAGKQTLAADARWKRINDRKESIRSDISSTAAREIGGPPD